MAVGEILEVTSTLWRLTEIFLFCARLAETLGLTGDLVLSYRLVGLGGRQLQTLDFGKMPLHSWRKAAPDLPEYGDDLTLPSSAFTSGSTGSPTEHPWSRTSASCWRNAFDSGTPPRWAVCADHRRTSLIKNGAWRGNRCDSPTRGWCPAARLAPFRECCRPASKVIRAVSEATSACRRGPRGGFAPPRTQETNTMNQQRPRVRCCLGVRMPPRWALPPPDTSAHLHARPPATRPFDVRGEGDRECSN